MREPWTLPFLDALRTTGNVAESCRRAGVGSHTAYQRRQNDADFANDWDNALEDSIDTLEAEARRRALEGINEPVVYQGQLTPIWERDADGQIVVDEYDAGTDKDGKTLKGQRPRQLVINGVPQYLTLNKRSDSLLMFLLKGLRKKYGTETTEISGPGGAPVAIDSSTRAARLNSLLEIARQRKATSSTEDLA